MRRTVPLLAATAFAASLSLTACSSDSGNPLDGIVDGLADRAFEELVEGIVEQETGEDFDLDFDLGGGSADGPSLPSDFPSGMPVPEGQLFSSLKLGDAFILTFHSELSAAEQLVGQLTANGYELVSDISLDTSKAWNLMGGEYVVLVSFSPEEGGVLGYTLQPQAK